MENESLWCRFKRAFGIDSRKRDLTAEDVYFRTKYGNILDADHYVRVAQSYIRRQIGCGIESCSCNPNDAMFRTFYCIVDLDPEMSDYVDAIFEPFREAGFVVAKVSGAVSEVKNDLVYLVSWDRRS